MIDKSIEGQTGQQSRVLNDDGAQEFHGVSLSVGAMEISLELVSSSF